MNNNPINKNEFNFFTVLSKDDKELVHSSFLEFLFGCDKINFFDFFNESDNNALDKLKSENIKPKLELSFTSKRKQRRYRFDLYFEGEETIFLIENKFKAFPTKEQLDDYSDILKEMLIQKSTSKNTIKYLLCFDKTFKPATSDFWFAKDYQELCDYLVRHNEKFDGDERIFVNHYIDFLNKKIKKYKDYKNDILKLFDFNQTGDEGIENKDKNFWYKLIYTSLGNLIQKEYPNQFEVISGSGTSTTALIEFIPKKWYDQYRLLIQIQGRLIKIYCHPHGKIEQQEDLRNAEDFKRIHTELKYYFSIEADLIKKYQPKFKEPNEKDGTYYLCQFDFIDFFKRNNKEGENGLEQLKQCLLDFYTLANNLLNDYGKL